MNALELAYQVEAQYKSYLGTQFHFRDPELRRQFGDALDSGRLVNGPFLELTSLYDGAASPGAVLADAAGISGDSGFARTLNQLTKNLHHHQERSLRAVLARRNVVVATGTGSGKTEAFLYPILAHLFQEHMAGRLSPGVRALILYPMNALANDQRERLGTICGHLATSEPHFRISFGEYTGHTPENERDSFRNGSERARQRLPGELVFREEMQNRPPHILLTNYSMLEYMLLRPKDSPLFDGEAGRSWRFIVLDEAHQYRGARGIELAMLLRRLKRRLAEGGLTERLRCIATSATLADAPTARGPVAQFAERLFDEPFDAADVILAQPRPIAQPVTGRRISVQDIDELRDAWRRQDADVAESIASRYGIEAQGDIASTLGELLDRDERVAALRQLTDGNARDVQAMLSDLFPEVPFEERGGKLIAFIDILLAARRPDDGTALIHARFHLFVRALEGAFLQFYPSLRLRLDRAPPEQQADAGATFEIALCRECGQHYLLAQGELRPGHLVEPVRDPDDERFGVTYLRVIQQRECRDEDADQADNDLWRLCLQCGSIDKGSPSCGHSMSADVVAEPPPDDETRADQLKRCGICGYSASGRDPVREVVHGADGPNVVIATTLVRYQPEDRRKVLAFADSRQSAAFFAWFLQDSYADIQSRNLILKAAARLSRATDAPTLDELCHDILRDLENAGLFAETEGTIARKRETWRRVFRELLTDERRISLEGVGLVEWSLRLPTGFTPPAVLLHEPWSLSEGDAFDLIVLLLDSLRQDRAVRPAEVEHGVHLRWDDLDLIGKGQAARLGPPRRQATVIAWDGAGTRRVQLLKSVLKGRGFSDKDATERAQEALRAIWEQVHQHDAGASVAIFLPVNDAAVLNWRWYRLKVNTADGQLFRCAICSRLYSSNVLGRCLSAHCVGRLATVSPDDEQLVANHYRALYLANDLPIHFRVEEHTAQIEHTEAARFQREFREKQIQVLSCSTTFELGVDLGDLDTLLLRNVPPEPFNYAQRAGRSGRRETAGFVVAFCRRDPHDLHHFRSPDRMISGRTGPPVLNVTNERIIVRHMTAVALSMFLRENPQRYGRNQVKDLLTDMAVPTALSDLRDFVGRHRPYLEIALRAIVPTEAWDATGLGDGSWVEYVAGADSNLARAESQTRSDYEAVHRFKERAKQQEKPRDLDWAINRARTMDEEDVLGFLSRRAVIPKYGFPVDVVELDTQSADKRKANVLLARDLSIAVGEYAPQCDVVANKRQWTCYALKRVPEKEWDEYQFARCSQHHAFVECKKESGPLEPLPCGCTARALRYVIPIFGFTTSREGPSEPRRYRTREFTTRPYFAGPRGPATEPVNLPRGGPVLSISPASPGWMVILCEGPKHNGFYVCRKCGFGSRQRARSHDDPRGYSCDGPLEAVCLGHRFCTDVVRLQFDLRPDPQADGWRGLSQSLAQVVSIAAARVLEVERDDMSAVVATSPHGATGVSPIILYDTVPGGAGLVARLAEDHDALFRCLQEAQSIVSGECGCEPTTSCDGCLRTYRSRYLYELLRRGPAHDYLVRLLDRWRVSSPE